jgi:HEAT repeat protein
VRVAIAKIGAPAIGPLVELLEEKNADVNALAKKLDFKPGVIGAKAAYLLGDLPAQSAVPALLTRLKEPPKDSMPNQILRALGKIGEPAGLDAALAVLKDGKQSSEVRQAACDAVLAGRDVRALPTLLAIAKEKKNPGNLRVAAAMTLGRLGSKAEYDAFAPTATSEGYEEFKEVVERLELAKRCAADGDACYVKALDDKQLTHQEKAAFMLALAKDRKAAVSALVAHLGTPETVVRLAILNSMRRLADKSCEACTAKLKELLLKEQKLTTKIPAFRPVVDEMNVTLAALTRA